MPLVEPEQRRSQSDSSYRCDETHHYSTFKAFLVGLDRCERVFSRLQDSDAPLVKQVRGWRGPDLSPGSQEKLHAELVFKQTNVSRNS
jgi:hypothetical protein